MGTRLEAVNYEQSGTAFQAAENSKSLFEGCPGALGKLASKGMFQCLLCPSWPGGHKFTPDCDFFYFLIFLVEARLEAVNSEHPGWKPRWEL